MIHVIIMLSLDARRMAFKKRNMTSRFIAFIAWKVGPMLLTNYVGPVRHNSICLPTV